MNHTLEILITEDEIKARVREMAAQISRDYAGKELVAVGILKGAAIFMADLLRAIPFPVKYDFLGISSYGEGMKSNGRIKIISETRLNMEGQHILVIEDIVDTGVSLQGVQEYFKALSPESLRFCSLLDKPSRRGEAVQVDYTGFTVEDRFIVGYGMDVAERYRNLPYLATVRGGED